MPAWVRRSTNSRKASVTASFFVRSPLTASTWSSRSGSRARLVAMCEILHIMLLRPPLGGGAGGADEQAVVGRAVGLVVGAAADDQAGRQSLDLEEVEGLDLLLQQGEIVGFERLHPTGVHQRLMQ